VDLYSYLSLPFYQVLLFVCLLFLFVFVENFVVFVFF
jgi:hypothetical protein